MARPSNTEQRREQIAEALLVVMAREGYDGASVASVARQAGVAAGLVHYHFRDKREILLVALGRLGARQAARVAARLGAAGGSPRQQLDAWLVAHLGVADAEPADLACWVMASGEALRDPEVRRAMGAILAASVAGLTDIVERVTGARGEARAVAVAIGALVQGYFSLAAVAPGLPPAGSALGAAREMVEGLLGRAVRAAGSGGEDQQPGGALEVRARSKAKASPARPASGPTPTPTPTFPKPKPKPKPKPTDRQPTRTINRDRSSASERAESGGPGARVRRANR